MDENNKDRIFLFIVILILLIAFISEVYVNMTLKSDLCKSIIPYQAQGIKLLEQMPVGYSCVWYVQGNLSGTYEQHSAWIKLAE